MNDININGNKNNFGEVNILDNSINYILNEHNAEFTQEIYQNAVLVPVNDKLFEYDKKNKTTFILDIISGISTITSFIAFINSSSLFVLFLFILLCMITYALYLKQVNYEDFKNKLNTHHHGFYERELFISNPQDNHIYIVKPPLCPLCKNFKSEMHFFVEPIKNIDKTSRAVQLAIDIRSTQERNIYCQCSTNPNQHIFEVDWTQFVLPKD